MSDVPELPATLSVNAWTGDAADNIAPLAPRFKRWAQTRLFEAQQLLAAPPVANQMDWRNSAVGWGLILADDESLAASKRALPDDAPDPIQRLWRDRIDAPVFRYRNDNPTLLRRYYTNRAPRDLDIAASERGIGDDCIPKYLLIYGSPKDIPWRFQFELNSALFFVGRLDLEDDALENYVNALLTGWKDAPISPKRPVLWSTDHSVQDITNLMRRVIAEPLAAEFTQDADVDGELRTLFGPDATVARLADELKQRMPALVVTTSHGMTGPLDDVPEMAKQLGCMVDQNHEVLKPAKLLEAWQPSGAIWYSHACCSAGSVAKSAFADLFNPDTPLNTMLTKIAAVGECSAPLPRALLGAKQPLRAFIGHVEPTFDWPLRQPATGQKLTSPIIESIYGRMYLVDPEPVAMALNNIYLSIGVLFGQWNDAREKIGDGHDEFVSVALRCQLAALDRRSTVILGDPTATIPKL